MAAYELEYTAEKIDGILESVDQKKIYDDATISQHGLMSAKDKSKIEGLPEPDALSLALDSKVAKCRPETAGNLAKLTSEGNVADSGYRIDDFATQQQGMLALTAYQKPQSGIPVTDLDLSVQNSLRKADKSASVRTTTYSELKSLRDGSNLETGSWYRITDYECTTTQRETQSAGHQFDIIVHADDRSHINECASAAHHEGDAYFSNCKLETWELKYSMDNDTSRFSWADTDNGKGVVYYMKDEFGNECQYDFKNILFKRYKIDTFQKCQDIESTSENNGKGFFYGAVDRNGSNIIEGAEYGSESVMCYTFSLKDMDGGGAILDGSVKDDNIPFVCAFNVIRHCSVTADNMPTDIAVLGNNVFFGYSEQSGHSSCYGNHLGVDCENNTFGHSVFFTHFMSNCSGNILCDMSHSNCFGSGCNNNILGMYGLGNTFGNICSGNVFGSYCYTNTFGEYCEYNRGGIYFNGNVLESNCYNNVFGFNCISSVFGSSVSDLTVCDNFVHSTVGCGVKYCDVTAAPANKGIKWVHITDGTSGSRNSRRTITFVGDAPYQQYAGFSTSGSLKIWNPADFAQ